MKKHESVAAIKSEKMCEEREKVTAIRIIEVAVLLGKNVSRLY